MIEKKPTIVDNFRTEMLFYNSARNAFKDLLSVLSNNNDFIIYLPAYIGISPKEGSGIFDPICELGINYEFYKLDKDLCICAEELVGRIKARDKSPKAAVLLVHYFGYVDPNYDELMDFFTDQEVVVIEDCAHAMFTHLIDGSCGRGDYALYSLHKMLPYPQGGILNVLRDKSSVLSDLRSESEMINIFEYDFFGISKRRKENARIWEELCKSLKVQTLKMADNSFCTSQTYPILVEEKERYEIYQQMNDRGFGIISLYHTMIDELKAFESDSSQHVSKRILNLPVHQDVTTQEIYSMYEALKDIIDTH